MKYLLLALLFLSIGFCYELAHAQGGPSPTPMASQAVISASPAPAPAVGFLDFVKGHIAAIALVVYAILDVVIMAVPSLAGNGLLNQLFLAAGKLSGQAPKSS